MLCFTLVPKPFLNDLQNLYVNYAPLSYMIDNGIPWRHIFINEDPCIILRRVRRLDGNKMSRLVNLSTTTHKESYCFCVRGKPTTKSILMSFNFQVGTWIYLSKPSNFWCSAFTCLKFIHFTKNSAMSLFNPPTKTLP